MNDTAAAAGFQNPNNLIGFGYGIAAAMGILFLIMIMTLASYCCTRNDSTTPRNHQTASSPPSGDPQNCVAEKVLDEATISSYPKILFSEAKINHEYSTAACCSICLADYKNSDVLRVLPDCRHLFHLHCVDPWLRSHPTCPVC